VEGVGSKAGSHTSPRTPAAEKHGLAKRPGPTLTIGLWLGYETVVQILLYRGIMRLVGILSAFSLVVLFASCGPTQVGDKCLQDSTCGVGFICNHKIECAADEDCINGFLCNPQPGAAVSLCQQDNNQDGSIDPKNEKNTNTPEGFCDLVACDVTTICPSGFSCDIVPPATEGVCAKDAQ
jgi:hypothetical protein